MTVSATAGIASGAHLLLGVSKPTPVPSSRNPRRRRSVRARRRPS